MGKFRSPSFKGLNLRRGQHSGGSTPLRMPAENAEDPEAGGRHRQSGRHGVTAGTEPRNRAMNMDSRPRPPAGQHRKRGRPTDAPASQPEPAESWMPTKSAWRRLMSGETVNGYRLVRA